MKPYFSQETSLAHKGKKVPERSFFSFFVFWTAVFLLTGCFYEKNTVKKEVAVEEKNLRRIKKMEDLRLIRLLIVERGTYILAERAVLAAAEQLGLQVRVTRTMPENIVPLLRSDKADLAFGLDLNRKELARFRLEGYMLHLTDKKAVKMPFYFLMPQGSEELWGFLEKAALAAAANGRINLFLSAEEKEKAVASGLPKEKKSVKKEVKNNVKERTLSADPEKTEKNMGKSSSAGSRKTSRIKLKKRERLRAAIRQNLEKMKNLQKEKK